MRAENKTHDKPYPFLLTAVVVSCWYAANILLLLLNKFLLSSTSFRQPVFLTLCHMIACLLMSLMICGSGFMPVTKLKSKAQVVKICLLSVIFCGTIVLGNASLKYLPVSFTQAIGSTTPLFTAIFAFVLMGSRENMITYLALVPIMAGIAIASGGEPLFHLIGFLFCMVATAGRALKSVAQSMIMSDPSEKLDPMSLLLYMSVVCVGILVPLTMILEPTSLAMAVQISVANPSFTWWLLGNSILAYFVNLTNFLVTKFTSPLTLQVLGNAKGVLAAIISVMIFVNPVTSTGILGYALTVAGVFMYSEAKRRTAKPAPSHIPTSTTSSNICTAASMAPLGDATVVVSISSSPLRSKDVANHNFSKSPRHESPYSKPVRSKDSPVHGGEGNGKSASLLRDIFYRMDGAQHRLNV